jgi:hypothetical protein
VSFVAFVFLVMEIDSLWVVDIDGTINPTLT